MTLTVSLNPTSIIANGTSTTTATATVDDSTGAGVAGDTVAFTSTPNLGETVGTVMDMGGGVYTATITSSTTVGTATISATDTTSTITTTHTA
ncbi:MAG TPA: invasin domain 3-containing protein, partial [Solirubrobacteraceae bacterium]|nr:invasin domain 3-containing protein [Solirubrobacteraceae bacterium]